MRLNISILMVMTLIFAMLFANLVYAASIHGTVYDILLEPEMDVKLQLNTMPKQVYISKDGIYTFEVSIGNYTIIAETIDGYASEDITVDRNVGEYIIDIILEPTFANVDNPELNNIDITTNNIDEYLDESVASGSNFVNAIVGFIVIILFVILVVSLFILRKYSLFAKIFNKKTKFQDSESLQQHEGHISQKKQEVIFTEISEIVPQESVNTTKVEKILDGYGLDIFNLIKKNSPMTQRELRKQVPLSEAKISLIVAELEHDGKIKKIKKGRGNILTYIKD